MASFSSIHQAITRLQTVSASQLQLEPICIGPFRPPSERKLQAFAHLKRPGISIHYAVRAGLLVFATAGQDTATSTYGARASISSPSKESVAKEAASAKGTAEAAPKAVAVPKAAPAARPAKKVEKPYPDMIIEDVIPKIKSNLQKQEGISEVDIVFQDNQIQGSFMKNGIIYTFWAFFSDGKLEGARGFSISSHGAPPSTVEPFLIDEKKITADLLIFWVMKRLAAQNVIAW